MTSPRTDLSDFASGLATRLPGTWYCEYQHHAQCADQFPHTDELWAAGHVGYIISQYLPAHDAVLHGPANQRLYVADRPHYPHQFVVAPLAPNGTHIKPHHFDAVEEPNGIAVPKDPARAAARVARRVLPRYEQALQAVLDIAADQPDPPHRPAPPQVSQVLTLTLYGDGALGAPYESVPPDARMTLYAHGFQYHPHQSAFLLPTAYGDSGRALRVHSVVQQLTAKGIGVNLRHSALTTGAAPPPTTPKAAPSVGRTR
ncbi:hypothetical protein [Streptomyces sp. JJ38]|uniref:hypothetical protein n=1 Tax=Streptomyces sp. JJ38 TaxID=2738128 RepID=UPI001C57E20E|nr:hypothetical protein [Streptomyces sp. JJ38]MBW1597285.1 hypothetical protein [Streptomyces sp. JJ38]